MSGAQGRDDFAISEGHSRKPKKGVPQILSILFFFDNIGGKHLELGCWFDSRPGKLYPFVLGTVGFLPALSSFAPQFQDDGTLLVQFPLSNFLVKKKFEEKNIFPLLYVGIYCSTFKVTGE